MTQWEKELNEVLTEFKITKEPMQANAAEELASALEDYRSLADQYSKMMIHYCQEGKPIQKSGVWCCPACGKRVQYFHSHCHWCGKKMGWRK